MEKDDAEVAFRTGNLFRITALTVKSSLGSLSPTALGGGYMGKIWCRSNRMSRNSKCFWRCLEIPNWIESKMFWSFGIHKWRNSCWLQVTEVSRYFCFFLFGLLLRKFKIENVPAWWRWVLWSVYIYIRTLNYEVLFLLKRNFCNDGFSLKSSVERMWFEIISPIKNNPLEACSPPPPKKK